MTDVFTFDVLVLSGSSQWTSVSRWENATDARREARKLVSGKKHAGVKIAQEHFDDAENRFIEKTIFKHMKNEDTGPDYEDDDSDYVEFDDFDDFDEEGNWLLPIAGLVAVLAILLGVGIFFFDDKLEFSSRSGEKDYFVYELPAVLTNISSGETNLSVKINLQLELDNSDDSKAVELALAKIMESVIDELQINDPSDLRQSDKVQTLRMTLKEKIQEAMGQTNLNGVLFKSIQIFE